MPMHGIQCIIKKVSIPEELKTRRRPESPLGTTVAQAELQLSAPSEQAGRCGPGTG